MRPRPLTITALALAALAVEGCGEDPGIQQGTLPFAGTDTAPLEPMSSEMKKKMHDKSYVNKLDENGKVSAGPARAAESRPAGEPKPAKKDG